LVRLLLGFEEPDNGAIYYDDFDLAQLDLRAVRRQLGVVLQDNYLEGASIFDNIAAGIDLSLAEAWEAAELAGLADEIRAMPMGISTIVAEGGKNLSGGQRQRLLIARALRLQPAVLIFDEATSFLDNYAQSLIRDRLDQLNVTRIIVAHRLSTIQNADRIYVLDAGTISQQGTFTELMTQEGTFQTLMQRQML
jgi:ATP-binding cassette subfamily C protein